MPRSICHSSSYLRGPAIGYVAKLLRAGAMAFAAVSFSLGSASAQSVVAEYLDPYKAHINISNVGQDSAARVVNLPLGKSVIVTVPRDVRDVLVSGPEIVDAILRGPRTIYLTGTSVGDSSVFFFDRSGRQVLLIDARVSQDLTELRQILRTTLPKSSLTVQTLGSQIVLGGQADSATDATLAVKITESVADGESVVNAMSIASGQQVLVRVKVAEMSRTTIRQLGLGGAITSAAVGAYNITASLPRLFSASGSFRGGFETAVTGPGGGWSATFQALERSGVFRTLAEPNLTTMSGQEATFLAGGEYPFPSATPGANGGSTVSIEFKPYGVSLGFTPVVLSSGRISMKIATSVSDLSFDNAQSIAVTTTTSTTIPSIRVRRAATTVEVSSGSSLMMAGLLQDRLRQSVDGLPWLKEIPVIGALFRSRDYIDEATELVVIVSPLLVEGSRDGALSSPTDNFTPSDEGTALLMGDLNEAYTPPLKPVGQYSGEIGFRIE